MSSDTRLAIRGQSNSLFRANQTEALTGGTVSARIGGSKTSWGKINPNAVRPGLHAPSGPQPFISKGRIADPETIAGKLSKPQLRKHATSSKGSTGVSFSLLDGPSSSGYRSQVSFNKESFANKGSIKGKSFLTTTAVDSMQENPYTSGLETELIGQGHRHTEDTSMMQHSIKKGVKGGFILSSRMWQPQTDDADAGWGPRGKSAKFKTFDGAFKRMYTRGVAGRTDFSDDK